MDIKFIHVLICMVTLFFLTRWTSFPVLPSSGSAFDSSTTTTTTDSTHSFTGISGETVIGHTQRLIEIGNSRFVYEESRSLAREYIKDELVELGVPPEQIIWNRFEWTERHAVGKNITTTTWTGINIIVWSNSTPIISHPIRAIGAHYDTVHWGLNRTAGAHDNLAGTSLLIELIGQFFKLKQQQQQQQQQQEQELDQDQQLEVPYMFVFFDQEEPGALGSKSFVDHSRLAKNPKQFAYFINVDAVGHRLAGIPILQTYPYEHKGRTRFSPRWLVDHAIVASYRVLPEQGGLTVGSSHFGMSLLYQAHRYHLLSVPFLSDDGPFSWASVPTIMITDFDAFYGHNPDYHQITDQPSILDADSLEDTGKIILELLLSTVSDQSLPSSLVPTEVVTATRSNKPYDIKQNPLIRFTLGMLSSCFENIFSGNQQYLAVGPITLGYFEILSLVMIMISYIYFHSFQVYRNIVLLAEETANNQSKSRISKSLETTTTTTTKRSSASSNSDRDSSVDSDDKEVFTPPHYKRNNLGRVDSAGSNDDLDESTNYTNNGSRFNNSKSNTVATTTKTSFRGYRILFFHLLTLALISLSDTVYTFQLLTLSFISLATIHIHNGNINLITGFISGKKGTGAQELSLGILLAIYIAHSILIVIYGYDFNRKLRSKSTD
ncbi:hypothetical protein PPL_07295 [Heterostelium album PN500]|uniref:Peptidase M28 domain-containing protein n=1 Tax=Heterostelium pallidum (strain ATCC 26659 / Pp 5 / PN500) TaxID=670386 RepID=D3BEX9_HETP5|nr:hypothetical protein PPL_07295 [Heterostelium album PN500]EFA80460.1 hypothetical protein PPL_07295 [Heterostelium album PN500]|eukprot:XP_020432580.1 hypothetical protein PPL_07295 [Heterostelium album PN500]